MPGGFGRSQQRWLICSRFCKILSLQRLIEFFHTVKSRTLCPIGDLSPHIDCVSFVVCSLGQEHIQLIVNGVLYSNRCSTPKILHQANHISCNTFKASLRKTEQKYFHLKPDMCRVGKNPFIVSEYSEYSFITQQSFAEPLRVLSRLQLCKVEAIHTSINSFMLPGVEGLLNER